MLRRSNVKALFASTEENIITFYRYFSLIILILFYVFGNTSVQWRNKLIVVLCITISSITFNYLYLKNRDADNVIKLLVLIEIIGNVVLLIPTGGLESNFIWYSLNTIMVASFYLNIYYSWVSLLSYIVLTLTIPIILHRYENNALDIILNNPNLILSYILIIAALQLLSSLVRKLKIKSEKLIYSNSELREANMMVNQSLEHIMSLYQAVYGFTSTNDKNKLISLILVYTKRITNSPHALIYLKTKDEEYIFKSSEEMKKIGNLRENLMERVKKVYENRSKNEENLLAFNLGDKEFTGSVIKASNESYGVLCIEKNTTCSEVAQFENMNQLKFLSILSASALERFKLNEINKKLLIKEEQKRIANEIHDSICQRLFSISTKVCKLSYSNNLRNNECYKNEMFLISDSIGKAMKELRKAIYSLNSTGEITNDCDESIKDYLDDISKLNDVDISLNLNSQSKMETLLHDLRNTIYRIIKESCGNAIRHGKCKNIEVDLNIDTDHIKLMIKDDGIGFDFKSKLLKNEMGLGINSIKNLVNSFCGEISIDSMKGKGTFINIILPNILATQKTEEEMLCM